MPAVAVGHRERRFDIASRPWLITTFTALMEDFTMYALQPFSGAMTGHAPAQVAGQFAPIALHPPLPSESARVEGFPLQSVGNIEGGRPAHENWTSEHAPLRLPDVLAAPARNNGTQRAAPVLCPSALQTLYVCAGPVDAEPRPGAADYSNHPVLMPDARSERGQICNEVVGGSLLGTDGRNGTSAYEAVRSDVAKTVGDTARRWTGKPDLVGKKEWTQACLVREPVHAFVSQVNERLHEGRRTLPASDATEWMLRVALSTGSPMQQAMARADLPKTVAVCSNDWAKLALGIEQTGDAHWGMRHADVMQSARLPQNNTQSFMALATSMHTSLRPEVACQRLRNEMTALGVPTRRALEANDSDESYESYDYSDV
ncbi:hypothetical protein [Pandoraea pneumonica]|uniref:hypothetical protein n=1 Tax=Pandoraea pneumonica TaxID=2508299 RepID=UPI003CF0B675